MLSTWEQTALVPEKMIIKSQEKLQEIGTLISQLYSRTDCFSQNDPFTFASLPFDTEYQSTILAAAKKINQKEKLDGIVLVGIGGSNLGALAVHTALSGLFPVDTAKRLYSADTLAGDESAQLYCHIETELIKNKKLHLVIVSKSGSTLETTINAALYIELFKKQYCHDYASNITIITEKQSILWQQAEIENFNKLALPKAVGGRYSIFTAAGLYPLALLGHNIKALCKGAQEALIDTAATRAAILYHWYSQGFIIHDSFFFDSSCEFLGKWYRQLIAESTGKRYDFKGNLVETGITPTVSIGTTDLHSLFQLSIGGPRIKGTTFYAVEQNNTTISSPHIHGTPAAGISLATINSELLKSTQMVYKDDKRPFTTITFKKNECDIGRLLQTHMLEIAFLGTLLEINPFDQPEVERYKKEAKKLLKL